VAVWVRVGASALPPIAIKSAQVTIAVLEAATDKAPLYQFNGAALKEQFARFSRLNFTVGWEKDPMSWRSEGGIEIG
jgi:hypothetical protein